MKKLAIVLALFLSAEYAAAKDSSSGCGPAWYVFKDKSLVSSAIRATINGFSTTLVTSGMMLGTSNCAKHKIIQRKQRAIHYAMVSLEKLRQDAASGQGEWLAAYGETFGCARLGGHAFAQKVQANHNLIFASDDPVQIVNTTGQLIGTDTFLMEQCSAT